MLRNPFRLTSQHAQERLAQCKAPMAFVCAGMIAGALLPLGGTASSTLCGGNSEYAAAVEAESQPAGKAEPSGDSP